MRVGLGNQGRGLEAWVGANLVPVEEFTIIQIKEIQEPGHAEKSNMAEGRFPHPIIQEYLGSVKSDVVSYAQR